MKITLLPRPDNRYRTQNDAIAFHNTRKERMLSMPDIFQIVKEGNTAAIESLRQDFKDYWLVISTRIIYNKINLSATIIHNAGSKMTKQKEITVKEVPECRPTYIKELLKTEAGLNYVRALLDEPMATKEQISNFFVALSGKKESGIRFWTPTQSSRASKQVRAVDLCFSVLVRFSVNGCSWFDGSGGLSRGVLVPSAEQTKFFSNKAIFDIEERTITIPMQNKLRKYIEKRQRQKKKVKIAWKLKVDVT